MFKSLSDSLNNVFAKLKGKGVLTEEDVNLAMRQVRIALLEADVALPVVKEFIANVKEKAIGENVIKSIKPADLVIKIVQDELTATLGSDSKELDLNNTPPVIVMMVGLQGSGKTTSTAKLARLIKKQHNKKILLASLDVYRPAAQTQLQTLADQIEIDCLDISEPNKPIDITKRALEKAKKQSYDVVFLDTAGRLSIDEELMQELADVKKIANPTEIIFVADSLTGQDAVNTAKNFNDKLDITGIILTRMDGDARGGAALSCKFITGKPIKYVGVGEKINEFEIFHPDRVSSRILGMGDVVSLVEQAIENIEEDEVKSLGDKFKRGNFDLDDLAKQIKMMEKMGGVKSIMGMMPGLGGLKGKIDEAGMDDNKLVRMTSIISSMTKKERAFPKIINGSRRKRIASGAGVTVQDVNMLLKQYKQMSSMVKKFGKMDKKSLMKKLPFKI